MASPYAKSGSPASNDETIAVSFALRSGEGRSIPPMDQSSSNGPLTMVTHDPISVSPSMMKDVGSQPISTPDEEAYTRMPVTTNATEKLKKKRAGSEGFSTMQTQSDTIPSYTLLIVALFDRALRHPSTAALQITLLTNSAGEEARIDVIMSIRGNRVVGCTRPPGVCCNILVIVMAERCVQKKFYCFVPM